jgi:hypothetical protein
LSVIVVQQITARWTKATRGAARAARRNAVPEVARLPMEGVDKPSVAVLQHALLYDERIDFSQPNDEIVINPPDRPLKVGCVRIAPTANWVIATFEYDRVVCGDPERGRDRKELVVAVGQWAQFAYNGRFGLSPDEWRYEKTVVNVGLFPRLRPSLFVQTPPTFVFSSIGRLF